MTDHISFRKFLNEPGINVSSDNAYVAVKSDEWGVDFVLSDGARNTFGIYVYDRASALEAAKAVEVIKEALDLFLAEAPE